MRRIAQAFAGVAMQPGARAITESRSGYDKDGYGIEALLTDLRFEYAFDILENMVETADRTAVGELDCVVSAPDDLLDQRE